jgi:hypothetical protein
MRALHRMAFAGTVGSWPGFRPRKKNADNCEMFRAHSGNFLRGSAPFAVKRGAFGGITF